VAAGVRRRREWQQSPQVASSDIVQTPAAAFYGRLKEILNQRHFDRRGGYLCWRCYQGLFSRPGITAGVQFRSLLIGHCEGLDSERGIGRRVVETLPSGMWCAEAIWNMLMDYQDEVEARAPKPNPMEVNRCVA